MTIQEAAILAGTGITVAGVIANAAIAWWRIGDMADRVQHNEEAMWEKFSGYDGRFEELARRHGKAMADRENIFARLRALELGRRSSR